MSVTLFSVGAVLIRASDLDAMVFVFWRLMLAVPLLAAIGVWRKTIPQLRELRTERIMLAIAGAGIGLQSIFAVTALRLTSVASVSLIEALTPLVAASLGALLLRERLGAKYWIYMLMGLVGASIVVVGGAARLGTHVLGSILALAGVISFVAFLFAASQLSHTVKASALLMIATTIAAVLMLVFTAVMGVDVSIPNFSSAVTVVVVAWGGGVLGYLLLTRALQSVSPSAGGLVRLLQPVIAGGIAWIALGEAVSSTELAGGVLLLVGVGGGLRSGMERRGIG